MNNLSELMKMIREEENTDSLTTLLEQPEVLRDVMEELAEVYHKELSRKAKLTAHKRKAEKAEGTLTGIDLMSEFDRLF